MTRKKSVSSLFTHAALGTVAGLPGSAYTPGFFVHEQVPLTLLDQYRERSRSDFIAIVLVTAGELVCSINLRECVAKKNHLVILSPGKIKQLLRVEPGTRIAMISFTPDFITDMGFPAQFSELIEYFSSSADHLWQLEESEVNTLQALIRKLRRYAEQVPEHLYGKEMLYHQFYIFFYEMTAFRKKYSEKPGLALSRREILLQKFTALVKKQYKKHRTVNAYARQLHVTPKYLSAVIKEQTGKTAGDLIDDYLVLEARYLLHNPDFSIAEIAHHLNFPDPSLFGKFFKRHTGETPGLYRAKL